MTIPNIGRCMGSSTAPLAGTEQNDGESAVCPVCSGRFPLHDGALVEHEPAAEDERETERSDG